MQNHNRTFWFLAFTTLFCLTSPTWAEESSANLVRRGEALIKGNGVVQDKPQGLILLEHAAQTNAGAKAILGNLLVLGIDLPQDVERGLKLLEDSAAANTPAAFTALGSAYLTGTGVKIDPAKARTYLDKAVVLLDVGAQIKLGEALVKGQFLAKDTPQGMKLLETATIKSPGAKVTLGNLLIVGIDVPKDSNRGMKLLEEAAIAKNPAAFTALGTVYLTGVGAPRDPFKAREYFEKAIALNDVGAQIKLGEALIKGQFFPKDQNAGLKLLEAAAAKSAGAKVTFGNLLIAGTDLPADPVRGVQLLEAAALTNNPGALSSLGSAYLNGNNIRADPIKARKYLERAIALNDLGAQIKLGETLIKGQWLAKDAAAGLKLLESATAKSAPAKVTLANLLLSGTDLPKDTSRGLSLLKDAITAGAPAALTSLGAAYLTGNGVVRNPQTARSYFEKAIALKDQSARIKLGEALIKGQFLKRDTATGLKLLENAAATSSGAKVALGNVLLFGQFVKADVPRATSLLVSAGISGVPAGYEILSSYYLTGDATRAKELLAVRYLTQAGTAGLGSSWASLARAQANKHLSHTKNNFQYYATKARALGNKNIEVYDATRFLWGQDVPKDPRKYIRMMESASASGNASAAMALIQTYRNGAMPVIQKNTSKARLYLAKYRPVLNSQQTAESDFLMRLSAASTPDEFKILLNERANAEFFNRADFQNQIFSTNRNFMIYRAQAGLKRGRIYAGTLTGTASTSTVQSMDAACKNLICGPAMLAPENMFLFATTW